MSKGVLGFNVTDFGFSRDVLFDAIRKGGGKYVLVRDSPQLVSLCNAAGMTTIYRQAGDDPGANPLGQDPAAFVRTRAQQSPDADFLHLTNEINYSPAHDAWTLAALAELKRIGRRGVIFNHSTNQSATDWNASKAVLRAAIAQGCAVGVHVYCDGVHDDGGRAWQPLAKELGGDWFVTEYAYIHTIFDEGDGWRGDMSSTDYLAWLDARIGEYAALGYPLLLFSLEHWRNTAYGREQGFGTFDDEKFINGLGAVNARHPLKEALPMSDWKTNNWGSLMLNATVRVDEDINLRTEPRVATATKYGTLRTGDVVNVYENTWSDGTYHWRKLALASGDYYAAEVSGLRFELPILLPPGDETYPLTGIQLAEAQALAVQARTLADGLDAWIKGVVPPVSGNTF